MTASPASCPPAGRDTSARLALTDSARPYRQSRQKAATRLLPLFGCPDRRPYTASWKPRHSASSSSVPAARSDVRLIVRRVISEARDDHITTTAQALAYSVLSRHPGRVARRAWRVLRRRSPRGRQTSHRSDARRHPARGSNASRQKPDSLENSPGRGVLMTVVGLVLAIWTTSSAATTLMQGITTAFDREDRRGFLRKRLLSLLIVLCLVAAAALVGCSSSWPLRRDMDRGSVSPAGAGLLGVVDSPMAAADPRAAYFICRPALSRPRVEQPSWKWVTPGAIVALVIGVGASGAFSFYASRFGSYQKTWGTLSAVVVMLIWLWLTNAALLLGAEVNARSSGSPSNVQAERSPSPRS